MPRIKLDPLLWRTIRAAAALEGINPGRWLENLAREELATSLPTGPVEPSGENPEDEDDDDGPES